MRPRANLPKIATALALAVGLVLPASALAEYYVPPGNSAANQYTESLPSAGGEKGGKGGGGTTAPSRALGTRNAQRLDAQGPTGEAAAEVAAETAPPASLVVADGGAKTQDTGGAGWPQNRGAGRQGQGQGPSGDSGVPNGELEEGNEPSGSSGISEVVSQATGASDSGSLGLWLPIAILLTLAGSIAYRLRSPRRPTAQQ